MASKFTEVGKNLIDLDKLLYVEPGPWDATKQDNRAVLVMLGGHRFETTMGLKEVHAQIMFEPFTANKRLIATAKESTNTKEDEADLLIDIGTAIGAGWIKADTIRQLRVTMVRKVLSTEGLYWRGVLDLLGIIESGVAEQEKLSDPPRETDDG